MTNEMNGIINTAGSLSDKSDRYIMLVALGFIIVGGIFVIRYLVNWNEKTTAKMEESSLRHETKMESIIAKGNDTQIELARVLERNSEALERAIK